MENAGHLAAERLLTFEVAGTVYAVPIADVAEVADLGRVACIPTLPLSIAGVMNHHGDVLPVVHRHVLFDVGEEELRAPQQVLVLADGPEDLNCLGLPVDRVLGLVDGAGGAARGSDPVAERRPLDGRVVSVLDTRRLLSRAVEVVEGSVITADPDGGEG